LVALIALGVATGGHVGPSSSAIVEAAATWEVGSDGAGRYRWTLIDGGHALGRSVQGEQVVGFSREDRVELTLTAGLQSGGLVTTGQQVAPVRSIQLRAAIDSLRAQRDALVAERALLVAGGRVEEVAEASRRVDVAVSARDAAAIELRRVDGLYAAGAAGAAERQIAAQLLDLREREVSLARAGVSVARAPARAESLASLDAQIAAADIEIQRVDGLLGAGTLASPIDGMVEIGGTSSIVRVYDLEHVFIRFAVPQSARGSVSVGDTATFEVDGLDRTWQGALVEVSESVAWIGSAPTFIATARLDNPDFVLRTGMVGTVTVAPRAATGPLLARLSAWLAP
jgi:hypothetical protein